jgi:hypothetical protein
MKQILQWNETEKPQDDLSLLAIEVTAMHSPE